MTPDPESEPPGAGRGEVGGDTECRRCAVVCEKVIYPAACVENRCPSLYAFTEEGRTFVGCLEKVYRVEIDMAQMEAAQGRKGGFGAVKAQRPPTPWCTYDVERAYEKRLGLEACVNPCFNAVDDRSPDTFRVQKKA